jgi:hypothetical protein
VIDLLGTAGPVVTMDAGRAPLKPPYDAAGAGLHSQVQLFRML